MFYIINTLQYLLYKEFPQHKIYRYLHFYYNINVITPYIPIQNTHDITVTIDSPLHVPVYTHV